MNYIMVKRLILKDWYMLRWPIFASLVGGVVALGVIAFGGKAGFMLGLILLITILVAVGAILSMSTTVQERKVQTLTFVMSLPISFREYTAAKILANLLIFLIPWIALVFGSLGLILSTPAIPHGLIPFVVIMALEILVSACLIFVVGLTSESQGWTIAAILLGNLALNGVGYWVAHIPSIGAVMFGPAIQWSPAAVSFLIAEFALIALLLGLAFFVQSRKKDFI